MGTKRSVLWPQKYAKIRFGRGSAPDPAGGAHDASPNCLVGRGGDIPPIPYSNRHRRPFGTCHASSELQPDMRLAITPLCGTIIIRLQHGVSVHIR